MNACLDWIDPYPVVMGLLIVALAWSLWRLQHSKSTFALDDLVLSKGKADPTKLAFMVALTVMTWGFVWITLHNRLTEWFVAAYAAGFAFALVGNSYTQNKFTQRGEQDEPHSKFPD